ncbi:MAG: hypothetical protein ACTTIR_05945 [Eggerthia catenaformis]|uniref:hypothetical protein n=1 Tax=Eggerthia catenaformis TaxID=31973 RepID=UPI003F9ECC3B
MRNPNNYGSVIKLSGKRRKPFMAKITTGYDELGRQLQKPLGYFETRKDAVDALAIYNLNKEQTITNEELLPQTALNGLKMHLFRSQPTMADIFDESYKTYYMTKSKSVQISVRSWLKKLGPLCDMKPGDLTIQKVQAQFDRLKIDNRYGTISHVKSLYMRLIKESIRKGYISPADDFSRYIDISTGIEKTVSKHKPFSLEEVSKIFQSDEYLIQIYILTGCRPNELLSLNKESFHIDGAVPHIITGSKTDAGRNRIVPLHPFILDNIKTLVELDLSILGYRKIFNQSMINLNIKNHTPYDTRHTFASLAKHFDMTNYYRKKIMGHKSQDLTDDVYTSAYLERMYSEICKIDIKALLE